ncbi:MlaD family protein [[Mycobacterium] burgundiense]|uniref:MlaD family protein n=1 Tax=[Mycobacterium] burgundiense TaxID=3064286 RepID=A0ABM9M689_9MYCO|nr:MlaD family protein [Mycolicibacterium sp. MU0053]CAJ1510718.1 MlaD family protein [Mycolicibacterium sp. MU0053]
MSARFVAILRYLRDRRLGLSAGALALMLVVGVAYLLFGTLQIDPGRSDKIVRVQLAETGGLLPGQDVTLRGVPVGRVRSIDLTDDGVVAIAALRPDTEIPVDSVVRVSALSPAGEQYLDFRADTSAGPYLIDGSEIGSARTQTPVTLATLLGNLDGTLKQVEPDQLAAVLDELRVGPQGAHKLAAILDGGALLVSTLDSVLPQTVSLLNTSKVMLSTVRDVSPGLVATSADLSAILGGVQRMDGGYRTLLDRGPETMQSLDDLIADNSPTMVQLLGNLTTVSQLTYLRVPALQAFFFPENRDGSALEALGSTFRDGGVWGAVSLYQRYSCDYNLPHAPPSVADHPEPYLYTYCPNPDPKYLVRGARNAPRPADDDTAGPPPGADPLRRADPTPKGPYTIPTPYAGPDLPLPPPPSGP